jgi:hypothetical protein
MSSSKFSGEKRIIVRGLPDGVVGIVIGNLLKEACSRRIAQPAESLHSDQARLRIGVAQVIHTQLPKGFLGQIADGLFGMAAGCLLKGRDGANFVLQNSRIRLADRRRIPAG